MPTDYQCSATTARGRPCRSIATPSGLCSGHDPTSKAKRARTVAEKRRGRGRDLSDPDQGPPPLERMSDVPKLIAWTTQTPMTAPERQSYLKAASVFLATVKVMDHDDRLKRIEELLEKAGA